MTRFTCDHCGQKFWSRYSVHGPHCSPECRAAARDEAQRESPVIHYVYFAQRDSDGAIKIGKTSSKGKGCKERIVRLCQLPVRATSLLEIPVGEKEIDAYRKEFAFHRQFAHLRVEGEWFQPGPDLLAFIGEHHLPC